MVSGVHMPHPPPQNHRQAFAALQLAPGQYNESMFVALDHILAAAGRHGVMVTLTITNWHRDYGGIEAYVKWVKVLSVLLLVYLSLYMG